MPPQRFEQPTSQCSSSPTALPTTALICHSCNIKGEIETLVAMRISVYFGPSCNIIKFGNRIICTQIPGAQVRVGGSFFHKIHSWLARMLDLHITQADKAYNFPPNLRCGWLISARKALWHKPCVMDTMCRQRIEVKILVVIRKL